MLAAASIGVPPGNLPFLDLPDGVLAARRAELAGALARLDAVRLAVVFAPFRYDVHRDHVALNRAARDRRALALDAPQMRAAG